MPLKEFFNKQMGFLEKLLTQKLYTKKLSKINKIFKNLFGFDHQDQVRSLTNHS